jgi:hypothetical protein
MSSSSVFDLALDLDLRGRLAELMADGCTLSSVIDFEVFEVGEPCEDPLACWGSCNSCKAEPRIVERERTRLTAFKGETVVWEAWV